MRVIALPAAYNEGRYIAVCLGHLVRHGMEGYLIDNCSTNRTVAIAKRYLANGLAGIETMPRPGVHALRVKLERKEELAASLKAEWFIYMDLDEIRPPRADLTLVQALEIVGRQGFNAVNFAEFVFIPTQESPDHDHPDFQMTMRWYYPFLPVFPHRLNACKRQPQRVDLASSGGQRIQFQGLRMYPEPFRMRHCHFLSVSHAVSKLVGRPYDPAEVARGWPGWRARLTPEMIRLPKQAELRQYLSDGELDASKPHVEHCLGELVRLSGGAPDTVLRS